MKTKNNRWEKVGQIDVDAGLCWIGDPCYWYGPDDGTQCGPVKTWKEFCAKLHPNPAAPSDAMAWGHPGGKSQSGMGVTVCTGYGDGSYDVEVLREDGRIKEVRVRFF